MRPFPSNLTALKAQLPSKPDKNPAPKETNHIIIDRPSSSSGPLVETEFINDLIRTGKAVERKPGQPFPPDAEYEIVREGKTRHLIHHQVSGK